MTDQQRTRSHSNPPPPLDRADATVALLVAAAALAIYGRTLAPDLLFGDSAEFQTLTYTLGMTHSTGYAIYLLLARLTGLLPLGTLAWRVNLFSAIGAAVAVGTVFLLSRCLTSSRTGALLGSIALGLSYTLWSQAIIAEVYAPAVAFMTLILLLLWRWQRVPDSKTAYPFLAALLTGLGVGVHLSVLFILPPAALLLVHTLWSRPIVRWRRPISAALAGLGLGCALFLLSLFLLDANDPPSNFLEVTIRPSRSVWGLEADDLDQSTERLAVILSGRQWQDRMFSNDIAGLWTALQAYAEQLVSQEFSPAALLLALLGLWVALRTTPRRGLLLVTAYGTALLAILNYDPPDKSIFYLPTFLYLSVALGAGSGHLLTRTPPRALLRLGVAALLLAAIAAPSIASRWNALRSGTATFVQDRYAYPLSDLGAPRRLATRRVRVLPKDALLALDWQALYTTAYIAYVERRQTGLLFREAAPYGSGGLMADTLVQELLQALQDGRPIYADRLYRNLQRNFRAQPILDGDLFRLSLR